jgi:hypothetical protein
LHHIRENWSTSCFAFFGTLTVWLERIEERRLSEHLASSTDLVELEHRMRSAERIHYFV